MLKRFLKPTGNGPFFCTLGFVMPLIFSGMLTLIGILASLGTFTFALFTSIWAGTRFGVTLGLVSWGAINFLAAMLWIWFVLFVTANRDRWSDHSEPRT